MYHSSDEKSLCFCFFHFFLSWYYQDWECWLQFKLLGMMLAAHISSLLSNLCPSNTELPPRQLPQDATSASNPPTFAACHLGFSNWPVAKSLPTWLQQLSCNVFDFFTWWSCVHRAVCSNSYAALFCVFTLENKEYSKSLKNDYISSFFCAKIHLQQLK